MQSGEMPSGNVSGGELMLECNTVDKTLDHVGKITLHGITLFESHIGYLNNSELLAARRCTFGKKCEHLKGIRGISSNTSLLNDSF